MNSRRKLYPDFLATPAQSLLLEAAEKEVSWHNISTLIDISKSAGVLDLTMNWDKKGNAFLGAIMNARSFCRSYDKIIPDDFLDQVKALDVQTALRKNQDDRTPLDLCLDNIKEKQYRLSGTLDWWIDNVPRQHFFEWKPRDRYGDIEPAYMDGRHLVDLVFQHERHEDKQETALGQMFALGVSPDLRVDGTLIYNRMDTIAQWKAFIEAGGDPHAPTKKGDDKPLWQDLVDTGSGAFEAHIRSWARDNAGNEIQEKEINEYWSLLHKKADGYVLAADVSSILTDHPDFLTLRDPEGRNCAMYGISMHASAWRVLDQKRFSGILREVDHEGLSLWHYALFKSSNCTKDTVKLLHKNKVPCNLDKNGCGLVASIFTHPRTTNQSDWTIFKMDTDAAKLLGEKFLSKDLGSDALWEITDEAAPIVFERILQSTQSSRDETSNALREMINIHIDHINHPLLLGAAALLNLMTYKGDLDIAKKAIDKGGLLPIPDDLMMQLRSDHRKSHVFEALDAYTQKKELDETVQPARGAVRNRRM